ncbi:potassium channel family protein [Streptomyces sp. 549]|uniref:potassium channel family protein n=1 Tax=Streptomyces sp. 549 TaxID=3049076 RepID=UPI0024C46C21|nr:potassium channel family protein [Streptomyces sp. 549]MDK1474091.1 potassium channel family protein [Streptomyces sp. 549]
MGWLITAAGGVLVLLALRDVFHTLWHPVGRGALSNLVVSTLWRLSRLLRLRRRFALAVGPLAMLVVVLLWTALVAFGWALVYLPHMPDAFTFTEDLRPADRVDFLDSLYFSLVAVATLGFGDIVPSEGWLRVAVPVQALIGFLLLTVFVSWNGQVHPALTRRRVLALRLVSLRRAVRSAGQLDPGMAASLYAELAEQITEVRVDLRQHQVTYYFHDSEDGSSLAPVLDYAADLAEEGLESSRADVRLSAAMLSEALELLAEVLSDEFLHLDAPPREVFAAYAADHNQSPTS